MGCTSSAPAPPARTDPQKTASAASAGAQKTVAAVSQDVQKQLADAQKQIAALKQENAQLRAAAQSGAPAKAGGVVVVGRAPRYSPDCLSVFPSVGPEQKDAYRQDKAVLAKDFVEQCYLRPVTQMVVEHAECLSHLKVDAMVPALDCYIAAMVKDGTMTKGAEGIARGAALQNIFQGYQYGTAKEKEFAPIIEVLCPFFLKDDALDVKMPDCIPERRAPKVLEKLLVWYLTEVFTRFKEGVSDPHHGVSALFSAYNTSKTGSMDKDELAVLLKDLYTKGYCAIINTALPTLLQRLNTYVRIVLKNLQAAVPIVKDKMQSAMKQPRMKGGGLQVYVKPCNSSVRCIEVTCDATAAQLLAEAVAAGAAEPGQTLSFQGVPLKADQALSDAGVGKEATVNVVEMDTDAPKPFELRFEELFSQLIKSLSETESLLDKVLKKLQGVVDNLQKHMPGPMDNLFMVFRGDDKNIAKKVIEVLDVSGNEKLTEKDVRAGLIGFTVLFACRAVHESRRDWGDEDVAAKIAQEVYQLTEHETGALVWVAGENPRRSEAWKKLEAIGEFCAGEDQSYEHRRKIRDEFERVGRRIAGFCMEEKFEELEEPLREQVFSDPLRKAVGDVLGGQWSSCRRAPMPPRPCRAPMPPRGGGCGGEPAACSSGPYGYEAAAPDAYAECK